MTTSGDAVIEMLGRGEEGKVSGAKNGGGWPVNCLRERAREHLKGLYLREKGKVGAIMKKF